MRWDVFCRVIDNHGDAGVCWRFAADLAARGERVRLWIDDPSPLAWMAPGGAVGVEVLHWTEATPPQSTTMAPGEVVVEAFGCDPPPAFVAAMAAMAGMAAPPTWINLEYLSAEDWVERAHALPSPQMSGPGRGLLKHFFFPGFSGRTGGLLREPGLLAARAAFERAPWLAAHGIAPRPGERLACLFCYDNPALPGLLQLLAERPTLLLATPGPATRQLAAAALPPGLRMQALPWLTQPDFDRLLWSCDLNLVRGEDSLVRATWAARPFVWQIYPQHDMAHAAKLDAFLGRLGPFLPEAAGPGVAALMRGWNGLSALPATLPDEAAWAAGCRAWCDELATRADLTTALLAFVGTLRAGHPAHESARAG